ncbi:autotransporter domain-containing protein [Achromobacter sp. Marseille-Q0513]|uniref:autotransporter domain-containing protein n=1 Tax=Achromobacter sp. Marseille-Q0513 TaxID=2829161 RepID=UPI0020126816|nr:autotransporter domain-containing protein [Achromobacter sp. Marseille-Q0513]
MLAIPVLLVASWAEAQSITAGGSADEISLPALQETSIWDYGSNLLMAGFTSGSYGSLDVKDGALLRSNGAMLGLAEGASTSVSLNKAEWRAGIGPMVVGQAGFGIVAILNGAKLTSSGGYLGRSAKALGSVAVLGEGSEWNAGTGRIILGEYGGGYLQLDTKAKVVVGSIRLADKVLAPPLNNGTNPTAGLSVVGGSIVETRQIEAGDGERASAKFDSAILRLTDAQPSLFSGFKREAVSIETGGLTIDTQTHDVGLAIGLQGGGGLTKAGSGKLTLGGVNSYAGDTNVLSGTLAIGPGVTLAGGEGNLARDAGTQASVTVTGADAKWDTGAKPINVGLAGKGELTITQGGSVKSVGGNIGVKGSMLSTATVADQRSEWDLDGGMLVVGQNGAGILTIKAGGKVRSTGAVIGHDPSSSGRVTVQDAAWDMGSGTLIVGRSGAGALNIEQGGVVTSGTAMLGAVAGSSGSVTVAGGNARWSLGSGSLMVGYGGPGTLIIKDGGKVMSNLGTIGGGATGATGSVTVSGKDAEWDAGSSSVIVGFEGSGTLKVLNGGKVKSTGGTIGQATSGASGEVTISGQNAEWNAGTGQLTLGIGGSGASLSIDDGGRLTSNGGIIGKGNHPAGSATVVMRGRLTVWDAQVGGNRFEVGLYQGGELRVEQGARLLTREANVGYAASTPGESGRVTISGADSEWDAGANAIVLGSYGGNGELAVLNQGRVKAGAIMVGGDPANPGSDGTGVLRIGAGAVIETGQVATLAAGTGSVVADGGLLRLTGDQPGLFAGFKAGDIKLGANGLTIDINRPYSATAVAGLSGSGGLTKTGMGTLILDAPSSYQGPTIVEEGVLRAGANGSFVANGSYLINNAGALDLNGKALTMGQFGGSTGLVALTGASLTVDQAANTTFNGLIVDSGGLIKRGAGTLTLTGTTSYFGDTEVYGGSLRFGKGGNGGSAWLPGSATVHAGELAGDDGTRPQIDGRLTLADGARLSLAAHAQDPALRAGEVKIGNNVALNLSGIASLDGTPRTLIASGDRIDGDFGAISVGGVAGPADYLTVNTSKSPDGKEYRVAYDLSWTAANNLAHGSFTVDGLFTVGVGLTDQSVTAGSAWNGKTLTKAGAGTLVLTGDNRYTGGTRNTAGVLQIGDGGLTGSILGDVVNDGTLVLNRAGALTLAGNISGAGGLRQIGAGTVTLAGDNSYGGGTELRAGALQVSRDANLGAASSALVFNGGSLATTADFATSRSATLSQTAGIDVAAGTTLAMSGRLSGPGSLLKTGAGTLRLAGAGNAYGGTLVRAGTLIGDAASISGGIGNGGTVVFEQAADARYGGDIGALDGARGLMVKRGAGTLTLGGMSALDWSIEAGGLVTSTERMAGNAAIASGASLTLDQAGDAANASRYSGAGALIKTGAGTLTLNADSGAYTGSTVISGGGLRLADGAKLGGSLRAQAGTTLSGAGQLGSASIDAGATHAPGNPIGAQAIAGDYVNRGTLLITATPAAQSRLDVAGRVDIAGATLDLRLSPDDAAAWQPRAGPYVLISKQGAGAVEGSFASVRNPLLFLDASVNSAGGDGNDVTLNLARNSKQAGSPASTGNQAAVAASIDALPQTHEVWRAFMLSTDADGARQALTQLSGDMHAGVTSALAAPSLAPASRNGLAALRGNLSAPLAAGAPTAAAGLSDAPASSAALPRAATSPMWAQLSGDWRRLASDGNAPRLSQSSTSLTIGGDAAVGGGWRLGGAFGYTDARLSAQDRAASAKIGSYTATLYGGKGYALGAGTLNVTFGGAYSWHDIDSRRQLRYGSLDQKLTAGYHASTTQLFAETGYAMKLGDAVVVEPFAGLAWSDLRVRGFNESGGSAALSGQAQKQRLTTSLAGVRGQWQPDGTAIALRGMLGWRHAYGGLKPSATLAFDQGPAFSVAGTPIARDAARVELGADLVVVRNLTAGLSYAGEFGGGSRQHTGSLDLRWRF